MGVKKEIVHSKLSKIILFIGYSLLYVPLLCIVIYSFNDSRFMATWTSFSFKWYKHLFNNDMILMGTLTSFKVAAVAATISVILGTMAAIVITRFRRFRGRSLFMGMTAVPLIMPELVLGISLLMLFMTMKKYLGFPSGEGITTICIAHIVLTLSYVTMIIQARIYSLDRSIEEAALDLGASPIKVFFIITLPMIMSSIILAWLLAFALSLDDVVIASFVAGPGATTLPMVMFSSLRFGISPEINALASILILCLSAGVVITSIILYKKNSIGKD